MGDYHKLMREKYVEEFKRKHGVDQITIPVYDLVVLLECIESICDEYAGYKEINEVYTPILEKYNNVIPLME